MGWETLLLHALTCSYYTEHLRHTPAGYPLLVVGMGLLLASLWSVPSLVALFLPSVALPFFCADILALETTCIECAHVLASALTQNPLLCVLIAAACSVRIPTLYRSLQCSYLDSTPRIISNVFAAVKEHVPTELVARRPLDFCDAS